MSSRVPESMELANAVVKGVKKKINSLLSQRIQNATNSVKSGSGTEDIYQPQLWYIQLLMFLKDHEIPKASVSTSNPDCSEEFSHDGSQEDDESSINVEANSVDSISNMQSPELLLHLPYHQANEQAVKK
ncbi:hypothetical protein FQA39_LY06814 [Lamprigera yunnana]|nr:hypothetical protein FQA39_LY06814 [Lamprigera yunnana]